MTEKAKLNRWMETGEFVLLIFTVAAVPFFLDAKNLNFYILPKSLLLGVLSGLVFLSFVTRSVLTKQLVLRRTIMDLPILGLLFTAFLSAVFSASRHTSFFGRSDFFVLSFQSLLIYAVFAWLLVQHLTSVKRWQQALNILVATGGISALLFVVRAIFGVDILGKSFPGIWNSIDVSNTNFGVWLAAIFLITAGQLVKKDLPGGRVLLYFFVAIISFLGLITIGFPFLWWVVLAGLALLVLSGLSFVSAARFGWLVALFALAVGSVLFIIFGSPKTLQTNLPLEVSLSRQPSYTVAAKTVSGGAKEFFFGSGPGTFNYDFSKYRDISFNYDKNAATLRFNYPFSTAFAVVPEYGIVFTLALLFLTVFLIAHGIGSWRVARKELVRAEKDDILDGGFLGESMNEHFQGMDAFLLSIAWVAVAAGMLLMFYSFTLWWLWWLLLALTVAGFGLFNNSTAKTFAVSFGDSPERSAAFSFGLLAVAGLVLVGFFVGGRWYLADRWLTAALAAGNFAESEDLMKRSISLRDNELARASLAQVYLNEAVRMSKDEKPDVKKISELMSKAVSEAKSATEAAPRSVGLWENLATMYENAAVLVPDARSWAIKSLQTARELEPSNASLAYRLGTNFEQAKNWTEAIKNYQEAINLKKDFTESYTALANSYEQNRQSDKAIDTFSNVLQNAPTDIPGQYNYGRLLYNRNQKGDREAAERIWLGIIEKQPNYSNALFSLGVLYELRKDNAKALEYFYKVKELNPLKADKSNADAVKAIEDKIKKLIKK